ncbi:MAG: GAF domain-containing protein [Chloroflexi bacterium]|nr:GAF domain-containing protein [Chloroflexota bacterium]
MPFSPDETFRTLIENLYEVVFTLDVQGKFIYISPMIEQVSGYQVEEVIGKSFDHFVHPDDLPGLRESFKHTLTGARQPAEFRILDKHGEIHYVHTSSRALMRNGEIISVTGVLSDMTESKHSEDALRQAEEKYRNMVEWIPAAVYTDAVDEFSSTLFISPQIEKLTGYPQEKWIGDPNFWLSIVHPKDRSAAKKENDRTNRTGDPFQMEYRIIARDGREVWIRDESALLRDANGKPLCWQGVMLDITERKKAEQSRLDAENELRESEERYRRMVELSPEAIAIHSEGRLVFANPAAMKLIGAQSAEDVIGMPIANFVHPDSRELAARRIKEALAQQKALPAAEEKFIKLDGSVIDVEVATMPFPYQGKAALQVLIREITERKQSDALQEAVYQIAIATETTKSLNDLFPRIHQIISSVMPAENFYITLYDETGNFLLFPYFKDAVDEPYLGKLQPGKGLTAYVLRTGRSLLCTQAVHDELERQGAVELLGVPSAIWLGVPLIIEGKTIGAMVVQHYSDPKAYGEREQHMLEFVSSQVATAITRKQAEEALANSEASYRGLFNSVMEAIYIQDRDGRFLDVNDGAVKMYGYPREELVGKTPVDVSAPGKNDLAAVKKMVEQAFQGKPQRFEFWGKRSNGEIFPKDVRVSKGKYFGQDVVIAVAQDITERKKAEDALQRQLKELTILQAVALAGTEAILIDSLLERVTKVIVDNFSLESFGVMLYDNRKKVLRTHSSYYGKQKDQAPDFIPLGQGVTGHVAATGIPYRVGDVRKEKRYIAITPGMRSEVCVPIKAGDDLLGIINAESRSLNSFSAEDERLFVTIAGSLATTIQKLRLFEAEHSRRQEAETLRQAVATVSSSLELNDVLDTILASLSKVVAYDSASVILERESTGELEIVAGRGLPEGHDIIGKRFTKTEKWQQLVDTHRSLIMGDAQADPRFEMWEGTQYIRGWMAVPLVVRDNVIGYISLDSRRPNTYTEETAALAQTFAYPAAIAVENARLYESEQRRRQEAETLRQAATAVSSSLDLRQVLDTILISLKRVVPYDSASVMLLEGERLRVVAVQGFADPEQVINQTFPAKDKLFSETQRMKGPIILEDAREDRRFQRWAGTDFVRGWMGVPLIARGTVIGYITLDNHEPVTYDDESAALVQAFANQAATAIDNARLYEAEQRRRKEAETLRQVAQVVSASLDVDEVFRLMLEQLKHVLTFDTASVLLLGETGQPDLVTGMDYADEKTTIRAAHELLQDSPILKQMAEDLKPLTIADVREHPGWIWVPGAEHVRSFLAVPIIARQKMIGALMADSVSTGFFTDDEVRVAQSLAQHMAIAVENARLFESEQRRRQEAETLREAVSAVASTLDPKQSIQLILEQLERVVAYDSASVQIYRDGYLEIVGGRGWPHPESVLQTRFPVPGKNPNSVVIQKRKPLILGNAPEQYPPFKEEPHQHIKSWLGVPLIAKNEVIGMLAVDSIHENHFNEESARLAVLFASQVASTLENTRLYEQALQAAERRAVLHHASQEIARTTLNPEQVYEAVHRAAERLMPAEAFVISLLDETSNEILAAYLYDKGGRWPATRSPANVGLSGEVIASGKAIIVRDLSSEPLSNSIHFGEQEEVRSILAVPMRLGDKVIGMLSAQSYQPHTYTEEDQSLLEMLSAHAAVAIENARLYNETRQRLTELEMVNRISTTLREAQTVSEMLPKLLDETLSVLLSDAGAIWLYDSSRHVLKEAISRGWFAGINEWPIAPGEGIAGTVFQSGQVFISKEFAADPATRASARDLIPAGWGGACVPIRTLQETIGVLFFAVQLPRQILPEEVHLLTTLSEIAGNAIRRADLYHQTQRQVQRLASLRAIDLAINTILDLRVTLGILIDHILSQLKVDAVDVLLLNPRTQTLYHGASSGFRTDAVNYWQVHIGDDIAGKSVRTRNTIFIQNIRENTQSKRLFGLTNEHFESYFCVPLIAKGQVKGVMEIFHRSALDPDADWKGFLETLAGQAAIAIDNSVLFEDLQKSNVDLALAYDATIEGWSKALDLRDRETEGHTQRVTELTLQLAHLMGVSDPDQVHIRRGALLHDIGKMGVPDNILHKAGALTEKEWQVMHRHPVFAYEMLYPIAYLRPAVDIPYSHHERWNGKGYPRGLHGEEIPLAARLFAVVDVWDALISDRPYRKAWTKKAATKFIRDNSGILFDPAIAEVFLTLLKGEEK